MVDEQKLQTKKKENSHNEIMVCIWTVWKKTTNNKTFFLFSVESSSMSAFVLNEWMNNSFILSDSIYLYMSMKTWCLILSLSMLLFFFSTLECDFTLKYNKWRFDHNSAVDDKKKPNCKIVQYQHPCGWQTYIFFLD